MQPPKYPSTGHWKWSPTVHRDDSYHPDPEFFVGKRVIITEKIDGGNTCIFNGQVYARSVAAPSSDAWFGMVKKHHAWKSHQFPAYHYVYGEDIYGVHSIEYDPIREDETYAVFAIRHEDTFLAWSDVTAFCRRFDLKVVPEVYNGHFSSVDAIREFLDHGIQEPSIYGGEREGFVMRVADAFPAVDFRLHVCKYVRPNHVQTDQHWRRNWKPCKLKKVTV